jgi:hypothetical protein
MKPAYQTLKQNHYSSNTASESYVSEWDLFDELGYDYDALYKENPAYANTCAVRMSLALLKSSVPFSGRLRIKTGVYKGRYFEPGAKLLADQLCNPVAFGRPSIMPAASARRSLVGKKGVVLFWRVEGYGGGHIDLIDAMNSTYLCNSSCFFASREIWFWPLV